MNRIRYEFYIIFLLSPSRGFGAHVSAAPFDAPPLTRTLWEAGAIVCLLDFLAHAAHVIRLHWVDDRAESGWLMLPQ